MPMRTQNTNLRVTDKSHASSGKTTSAKIRNNLDVARPTRAEKPHPNQSHRIPADTSICHHSRFALRHPTPQQHLQHPFLLRAFPTPTKLRLQSILPFSQVFRTLQEITTLRTRGTPNLKSHVMSSSTIFMLSPSPSTSSPSPTSSTQHEQQKQQQQPSSNRRKRVSAEHTLTRVRENQRRHRARRKDYIAALEERLADAERQLAAAHIEIAQLKRERDTGIVVLPCAHGGDDADKEVGRKDSVVEEVNLEGTMNGAESIDASIGMEEAMAPPQTQTRIPTGARSPNSLDATIDVDVDQTALHDISFLSTFYNIPGPTDPLSLPLTLPVVPTPTGPPPCCEDKPSTSQLPPSTDPECSTCKTRPAPLPSESTTLCAQAYVMISQQNFRDVDAATIRLWLYQGYRRARRQGEGCRVENGALFRLLDYISGV